MRKKLLSIGLLIVVILFAKSALALSWEEEQELRDRTRIIEDEKRRMKMTPEEQLNESLNNFVDTFNMFTGGGIDMNKGKKQNTNVKNQNKKVKKQTASSNRNVQNNTNSNTYGNQDFHIGSKTLNEAQINAHQNK